LLITIPEVDRVMQQTAGSAEQSSAAAIELTDQAEDLGAMCGTFRIERGCDRPVRSPRAARSLLVKA
jgi:methyl-accepting chemotaxis protein